MTSIRTRSRSTSRTATSALLLALCLTGAAMAEEAGLPAPYRIGPGDEVDIQVWREADLSGIHRIDARGQLHHVLAGSIDAAGMTSEQLAEELKRRLEKDYLREARVIVTLATSVSRKAWVLGAVERPGNYSVTESTRMLDLIFAAGGVSEASNGTATFYRGDEHAEVDLAALLAGDLEANRSVAAGDVVVVGGGAAVSAAPSARIRVVGEVVKPGSYELEEAPTILDAVLAAGGFTDYAAANRARLVRERDGERQEQKIRLEDIVRGREGVENLALQDGDLIVVPESFF